VRALDRDGALVLTDGSVVRALELTPLPAVVATAPEGDALTDGLAALLDEMPLGETLQWYVESAPLAAADLLVESPLDPPIEPELLRRAELDRAALAAALPLPAGVRSATHLLVRSPAARRAASFGTGGGAGGNGHAAALARSLARVDALRAGLERLGLRSRLLDGPDVSRLLVQRVRGAAAPPGEPHAEVAGALDERAEARGAVAAAERLRTLFADVAVDFADDRRVAVGQQLEQAIAVAVLPGTAARGWIAALRPATRSHVLSVQVRRDAGGLQLSVGLAARERVPETGAAALAAAVDEIVRDAVAHAGAGVDRGEFVQRDLWPATLPIAGPGAVSHRVDARAAAAALPLFDERCGSLAGVPFGRVERGWVERLDPWDAVHRHTGVALAGGNEHERARAALPLLLRLAAQGSAVVALDLGAEGRLAAACAQLSDGATTLDAANPEDPGEFGALATALLLPAPPLLVLDAHAADDPLALAGRAAALLAVSAPPAYDDDPPAGGVLAIAGVERLLADARGRTWLRCTTASARRDGRCTILLAGSLTTLADAELLGVLPVRALLRHTPEEAERIGERLGLSSPEVAALARPPAYEHATPEQLRLSVLPPVLWLNGARGRAQVELLELPPEPAAA